MAEHAWRRRAETAQRSAHFGYVVIPVFLFLAALGGFAFTIQSSDSAAQAFSSLYGDLPHVAPPGLRLQDTSFEPVELSDGELVYVIAGKIANRTDNELKNIILEGLTFDAAGASITSLRASASSGVPRHKLELMSLRTIRQLQTERASQNIIKPGEVQPFTLILAGSQAEGVRFYTARVYSVSM